MKSSVLAVVAHPDDMEVLCAGTLALLSEEGWKIHAATMTAGAGFAEGFRQHLGHGYPHDNILGEVMSVIPNMQRF